MTKELIDKLISVTKEKKNLLENMYDITKKQMEEINKEEIVSLNEMVDQKDNIIKQIDKLDIEFLTTFSRIKKEHSIENIDELKVEKYPNLAELKETVKEISSTLMAISLLDEENSRIMKEKLKDIQVELRRINEGKKAYKGYNTTIIDSVLIDEKK